MAWHISYMYDMHYYSFVCQVDKNTKLFHRIHIVGAHFVHSTWLLYFVYNIKLRTTIKEAAFLAYVWFMSNNCAVGKKSWNDQSANVFVYPVPAFSTCSGCKWQSTNPGIRNWLNVRSMFLCKCIYVYVWMFDVNVCARMCSYINVCERGVDYRWVKICLPDCYKSINTLK